MLSVVTAMRGHWRADGTEVVASLSTRREWWRIARRLSEVLFISFQRKDGHNNGRCRTLTWGIWG